MQSLLPIMEELPNQTYTAEKRTRINLRGLQMLIRNAERDNQNYLFKQANITNLLLLEEK